MNSIHLTNRELRPGETVEGTVRWSLEKPPKDLELRIFWFTRGRGTEEAESVLILPLGGEQSGERSFSHVLPGSPWSTDGKLISIIWGVELVEKWAGSLALEEFTVGPQRRAVVLGAVELPRSQSSAAGRMNRLLRRKNHEGTR